MSALPLDIYNPDAYSASVKGQVTGNYAGDTVEVKYLFDIAGTRPTTGSTSDVHTIPSGSLIESCQVIVKSTISGGTNFSLGLSQPAGTVIDADGLVASATGTTGVLTGTGALIGTITANDGQLTFSGTRTAGVIEVVVKYRLA